MVFKVASNPNYSESQLRSWPRPEPAACAGGQRPAPRRRSAQGRARAPQAPFLPRTCLSPPRKQPGGHGGASLPPLPESAANTPQASRSGPLTAARSLPPPCRGRGFPVPGSNTGARPGPRRLAAAPQTRGSAPAASAAPRRPAQPAARLTSSRAAVAELLSSPRSRRSPRSESPPPPPASRAQCAEPGGSAGPAEEERGWRGERGAAADKASPRPPRSYL